MSDIPEVLVRLSHFARHAAAGGSTPAPSPTPGDPRLRTQLLAAHLTAAACNAGKVCLTRSPLSVSWAQWLALGRYLVPQLLWLAMGREQARTDNIERALVAGWESINDEAQPLWRKVTKETSVANS